MLFSDHKANPNTKPIDNSNQLMCFQLIFGNASESTLSKHQVNYKWVKKENA